jgi:hypothetical protein
MPALGVIDHLGLPGTPDLLRQQLMAGRHAMQPFVRPKQAPARMRPDGLISKDRLPGYASIEDSPIDALAATKAGLKLHQVSRLVEALRPYCGSTRSLRLSSRIFA